MPITPGNPFKGRHYSGEVILLAVRWYLRYPLAYEHVAEMLAERGLEVDARLRLAVGPSLCAGTQ
jgi:transposase-like protein